MSVRSIDWTTHAGPERDYLCVDGFLTEMVGARALSSAFEIGVVDYLLQHPSASFEAMRAALQIDQPGAQLLVGMLKAQGVLETQSDGEEEERYGPIRLTETFIKALVFRDLMEAKLYFANLVAPDFLQLLTALLMEPAVFFERARIFKLFSYQHAIDPSGENYEQTARWMRITTALTKYEAQACIAAFDFSCSTKMLDVGGNSGEFALRICRAHPAMQATVYDLPLVCDIGAKHVSEEPEAARIRFAKRDRAQPALPGGHDLIVFKSMLHDWPDAEMADFLQRAYDALEPGGTVMIFERCDAPVDNVQIPYGQLPLMMFFRSYRGPQAYRERLEATGFKSVAIAHVPLDMPFMLIAATK